MLIILVSVNTFYLQVQHPPLTHCVRHKASVLKATYFMPSLFTVPTHRNCNHLSYTQLWRHCTILRCPKLCWQIQNCTWLHSAICWCAIRMTWPHKHVYHVSHKRVRKYPSQCCMPCNDKTTHSCFLLSSLFSPSLILPSFLHFWLSLFLKSCAHPRNDKLVQVFPHCSKHLNTAPHNHIWASRVWVQFGFLFRNPVASNNTNTKWQATTQIQSGKEQHKYKVASNHTNRKHILPLSLPCCVSSDSHVHMSN